MEEASEDWTERQGHEETEITMGTFKDWSEAEIAWRNAKVAAGRGAPMPEPPDDAVDKESELHEQIIQEVTRRGLWFVHSRMDRPTTTARGVPDFIIANKGGQTLYVEAKSKTAKLTPEQIGTLHHLNMLDHKTAVVYNIEQFLKLLE